MAGLIPFNRNKSALDSNFSDFYNVIDDFFSDVWPSRALKQDTFKIDVEDKEKEYVVEAELAGFNKDDIELSINENRLCISVEKNETEEKKEGKYLHRERRYGSMSRSIYLSDIDSSKI